MTTEKSLKFGILCNSLEFEKWEADCIRHLTSHPKIHLHLLLVNTQNSNAYTTLWNKVKRYPYPSFFFRAWKRFFLKPVSYRKESLAEVLHDVPKRPCETISSGKYSVYFKPDDVAFVKECKLDFLLRFGFNIIKGDILNSCPYGVWSFHHADSDFIRGGPTGFWEIYFKRKCSAAVLQRLTNELDRGFILKKGFLKTINHSYVENIDQLMQMTAVWPLQVCLQILHNATIKQYAYPSSQKPPIYKYPNNIQFVWFMMLLFRNKLYFHYEQLFRAEWWEVKYFEGHLHDINKIAKLNPSATISFDANSYAADPFLWPDMNKKLILFEYFDYKRKKGEVQLKNLENGAITKVRFNTHNHLSYPFTMGHNQEIYCVPEQGENNKVSLYKIQENGSVAFVHDLIKDFQARDSTLIFYNGFWWLFCTRANYFENAALFIFYATTLFEPFKPHLQNPVKVDINNARPAGAMFINDGTLFRPAQDSAKHYGHCVHINKVTILNTYEFKEEPIQTIYPQSFGNYKGIHHISSNAEGIALDLKKSKFSFSNFKNELQRKFRRLSS